ncbi:hypothetical protein ABZ630_33400, partial [Streptomyces albidoflavus]
MLTEAQQARSAPPFAWTPLVRRTRGYAPLAQAYDRTREQPPNRGGRPTVHSQEATAMGLGGCIILIAVGAILTFATDFEL